MQAKTVRIFSRIKRSAFAWPLALVVAALLLLISETGYHQSNDSLERLTVMGETRSSIRDLQQRVTDAETGERGYLLTGRKEYLEPYVRARADIEASLASLNAYYAVDPKKAALMKQLDALLRRKLSELSTVIDLYDQGKGDAWRAVLLTDVGKEQMDSLREISDQLLDAETRNVMVERKAVGDTLQLNRIGVAAMTVISLLALFMYLRQTNALNRQNAKRAAEIARDRDRLEAEIISRTAELTELAQHLENAREDERSSLARELHDELGALLTAAKLDAARIKSRLGTLVPEANERLAHLNETLNHGIALKRRIIEDLRPSSLSNLGLIAALEIQTREFEERSGIPVETHFEPVLLSPASELTIYRLVQEAFTNIAKYAKASTIEVALLDAGDFAEIYVKDDGTGFDMSRSAPSAHGLLGMRYRVNAEGGQLKLESAPGKGTRISASLPKLPLLPQPIQATEPSHMSELRDAA